MAVLLLREARRLEHDTRREVVDALRTRAGTPQLEDLTPVFRRRREITDAVRAQLSARFEELDTAPSHGPPGRADA